MIRKTQLLLIFLSFALTAEAQITKTSFSEIAKNVEPAVVSIEARGKSPKVTTSTAAPADGDDDILEYFRRQMPQRAAVSLGSGFLVDKAGYIVTNEHVVDDAVRIKVKLDSGEEYVAKLVGTDPETDIAILKIDTGRDLPFVKFGNSDDIAVGDWVLAIGSPFGLSKSVTAGIISQVGRVTPNASAFQKFIQTDAAINRGNSGGPLVDLSGEVIGVNSQIATSTGDYNGVGFALPSREAEGVYRQIVANGKVKRGYLGAYLDSVKAEFAKVYGLSEVRGAIITEIRDKQSPAGLAGLLPGDVLVEFNGEKIIDAPDLIARIAAFAPQRTITLDVLREKGSDLEKIIIPVKLGERPGASSSDPKNEPDTPVTLDKKDEPPFGIKVSELTPTLAATYKFEGQKGVLVRDIDASSILTDVRDANGREALVIGDLIQRVNRIAVKDLKSFNAETAKIKPGDPVVLQVIAYNPILKLTQMKLVQFTAK